MSKPMISIDACASRYKNATEPFLDSKRSGQQVLYLFDGSGSWGTGVEAAAWFRKWVKTKENQNVDSTRESVSTLLRDGIQKLPETISGEVMGWTFSVAVVICNSDNIQVGVQGCLAVVLEKNDGIERLFTPKTIADELAKTGTITEEEAKKHKYRNVHCGRFFGDDGDHCLTWNELTLSSPNDQLLIGYTDLIRYLESDPKKTIPNSPVQLRDEIELFNGNSSPTAFGGKSSPTAILRSTG